MESTVNKILVIDDEKSTLTMLGLLLRTYGYEVLTAESGEKGLKIFRKEEPPIVLTDIRMPDLDGLEVLKQLKQLDPRVEVIVITGHGDMEMAVQALQHEASDFINKPIQKDALDIALQRAREKIRLKQQLEEYTKNLESRVQEATAELEKSCQRLETLCEVNQQVGEMPSLSEIIELLRERIESITRLQCRGMLVVDSQSNTLLSHNFDAEITRASEDFISFIKKLDGPHLLTRDEKRRVFVSSPEPQGKDTHIVMLPIARQGEFAVGAALVSLPEDESEEEVRLATFLLSQAAGAVRRAARQEEELKSLRRQLEVEAQFGELIGKHEKMQKIYQLISNVAESDASVLIQGESGTGKELIARRLHELSHRRHKPFEVINCGASPQTLLESKLFGHEKGAFTDALHTRKGIFELADQGTIFLDEIGEVPLEAQVKLLRVLQFKEFQRVGGEKTHKVNVRVVAATSKNLWQEMKQGRFREDLYYRLHVIPITVPPLRERLSDLPILANHFLKKFAGRGKKEIIEVGPEAMDILLTHTWPGNVRELENVMEHAVILAKGESIKVSALPGYLQEAAGTGEGHRGESLEEMEREHLLEMLDKCEGNKNEAARRLRISRSTLYRKLERYGIVD